MSDLEKELRHLGGWAATHPMAAVYAAARIALEHAAEIADRDNEDDPFDVGWAIRAAARALGGGQ